jgi:hypothetical protein
MGGQFGGEFEIIFKKNWKSYLQLKTGMYDEDDISTLEEHAIDVDTLKQDTNWSKFQPFLRIKDTL